MPLDVLCARARVGGDAPRRLVRSAIAAIGIGLQGRMPEWLRGRGWMYFPGTDCPFHRITVFSNYSPGNVPDPERHWSLMAEVGIGRGGEDSAEALAAATVRACRALGLVDPDNEVVSTWVRPEEHAYPVPVLGRDPALRAILHDLAASHIYSRGRFGGWKYEVGNQDHSLMQGIEWARRMTGRGAERLFTLGV